MGIFDKLFKKGTVLKTIQNNTPTQANPPVSIPTQAELMRAAREVFHNPFSDLVYDATGHAWEEPIRQEITLLQRGGVASAAVMRDLLLLCANGGGLSLSESWWYSSIWAVRVAAMLPAKEAGDLLCPLLERNSNIMEWFTYVQKEAAKQLCVIGTSESLPRLKRLLEQPLSMTPVSEIAIAVEKLGGTTLELPSVRLSKAQNQLGDEDGIAYLLPMLEEAEGWPEKDRSFYYYLLARKAERKFDTNACLAFYAAQVAACPDSSSMGWQSFIPDGFRPTKENAELLHNAYPLPKTMGKIQEYSVARVKA